MGIRFRCHHCEHELNLKEFQGGRRARCPGCGGKFRVPTETTDFSVPLEDVEAAMAGSISHASSGQSNGSGTFDLKPSSHDAEASRFSEAQRSGRSVEKSSKPSMTSAQVHSAPTHSASSKTPAAIAEAPEAIWYVRPPTGGQYGPADAQIFLTWLQDFRVSADSLVWRDGWPQWMVAGEAFEDFFGSAWRLAEDAPLAIDSAAPAAEQSIEANTAPASAAVAGNPVQVRRKKQQSNYTIFIALLVILAIALAVVLARVLLK